MAHGLWAPRTTVSKVSSRLDELSGGFGRFMVRVEDWGPAREGVTQLRGCWRAMLCPSFKVPSPALLTPSVGASEKREEAAGGEAPEHPKGRQCSLHRHPLGYFRSLNSGFTEGRGQGERSRTGWPSLAGPISPSRPKIRGDASPTPISILSPLIVTLCQEVLPDKAIVNITFIVRTIN